MLMREKPSCGCHQGACGHPSTLAATKTAPPSGGAVAWSWSHAPAARSSSQASAWSRMRSACSVAAGWLRGVRPSGSSAVAEAAVGVAVGGDGGADRRGVAAAEQPLEAAEVEDAAVGREELLGVIEIGHGRYRSSAVLNGTDTGPWDYGVHVPRVPRPAAGVPVGPDRRRRGDRRPARRLLGPDLAGGPRRVRGRARHRPVTGDRRAGQRVRGRALPPRRGRRGARAAAVASCATCASASRRCARELAERLPGRPRPA